MVAGSPVTSRCYVVATFRRPERSARKQRRRIRAGSQESSVWKIANWQATPQQIPFAVLSTGGSSWAINVTYEDASGVFRSPRSSTPTGFTLLAGSSNQFITVGTSMLPIAGYPSPVSSSPTAFTLLTGSSNQFITVGSSMLPIAGYQFCLNTPSSVGASVTMVAPQAGVG